MKIRKKKLYEYDIRSGHYIRINEDDNVTTDASQSPDSSQLSNNTQTTLTTVSLSELAALSKANEVDAVEKQKVIKTYTDKILNYDTKYDNDISAQRQLLAASDDAVAKATDVVTKTKAQSDSLQIRKTIADIELKHTTDVALAQIDLANELYKLECTKLDALLKGVNDSANESYKNLPKKYRNIINESNIHQAKIYMTNIVVNDDEHILKDMRDFKRAFCESELVFGKDKKGFFVLCIDLDDFNKLYATLQEVGYRRDDIFANVMPQVLDRSQMISIDTIK